MFDAAFVMALQDVRRRLTAEQWLKLVSAVEEQEESQGDFNIAALRTDMFNNDALWLLDRAFKQRGSSTWAQIAAAMSTVDVMFRDGIPTITPVWSGPANGVFPVRRFDQVLYDLITQARQRILIVTFAAHKVAHLCDHLQTAVANGVTLTLVLEAAETSEGQLSFDALNAFSALPKNSYAVYYWPLDYRPRNSAGRPGKLHAKCAVVDSTALVGSGNLTDDAFNRNMELGLLVNNLSVANLLHNHFTALINSNSLMKFEK